jgi:hypothetical protein
MGQRLAPAARRTAQSNIGEPVSGLSWEIVFGQSDCLQCCFVAFATANIGFAVGAHYSHFAFGIAAECDATDTTFYT